MAPLQLLAAEGTGSRNPEGPEIPRVIIRACLSGLFQVRVVLDSELIRNG